MTVSLERCVDFLQRLIQTPSLPGEEAELAQLVVAEMKALSFDEVRVDDYGNVIGRLLGGDRAPVHFNTHLDHVDVGDVERWPYPPFGGEIHDGKVWGRGAVDIKGPLAAQVYGVARLLDGERPAGDVYLSCVVQEEIGGVGARHLARTLETPTLVIGEPSCNTVRRGHRGRTELVLHLVGRSVHASVPEQGVNPLTSLGRFLAALDQLEHRSDPALGSSSVAPTLLRTDQTSANVIPGEVWLTCDWRNVAGESGEDALQSLQSVLDATLGDGATGTLEMPVYSCRAYTGSTLDMPANNPAYILPLDHPAVRTAERVVNAVSGESRPVGVWEFATDGGHFAAAGMAPVGFGPGDPYLAHTVNEQIEIAELETAIEINRRLALALTAPMG